VSVLSTRFAIPLLVIYGLAAVPVALHSFAEPRRDDCERPGALPRWESDAGERGRWLRERYGAFQWSEGSFEAGQALFSHVYLRSYDVVQLLNRPENSIVQVIPDHRTLEWIETERGAVPIHRAIYESRSDRTTRTLAGYLLIFEGEPLARATFAQLLSAPRQLLLGRSPMTLLLIHGRAPREQYAEAEVELRVRLLEALQQYRDACSAALASGAAQRYEGSPIAMR
jgi:hypothetical protein